jgi:Cu/Ag efflux protein CusF
LPWWTASALSVPHTQPNEEKRHEGNHGSHPGRSDGSDRTGFGRVTGSGRAASGATIQVAADTAATATGIVKKVDAAKRNVNLSHEPIPAIGWPAMTMDFKVAPDVDLNAVKPGQPVEFSLAKGSGSDYTVTSIKPKK